MVEYWKKAPPAIIVVANVVDSHRLVLTEDTDYCLLITDPCPLLRYRPVWRATAWARELTCSFL